MVVIRVDFARARLADAGRSESFENQIAALREARVWSASGFSDRPRYGPATIERLVWALAGRGPDLRDAVFQLTQLLAAAGALAQTGRGRGSALSVLLLIEGPARAGVLAAGLARAFAGRAGLLRRAEEGGLELPEAGGGSYRIAEARLPMLFALLEFAIGLEVEGEAAAERDAALAQAERAGAERAGRVAASNRLAAALSRHLDGALRGRAARDRLTAIARFLDARAEVDTPGAPPCWRIDDEATLAFWEAQAGAAESGGEARLFRTAHRGFAALSMALREGEAWRGLHRDRGHLDAPDALEVAEGAGGDATPDADGPLARLTEPPLDRVKLLNRAEREGLDVVDALWRIAPHLPLSALRTAAMGAAQNAVVNAQRFGRPVAPLLRLDPAQAPSPYAAQLDAWRALAAHLLQARLAAAHVVATQADVAPPAMAEEARRAFRSFRRAGFAEALEDPDLGEAFGDAIAPLARLSSLVESLLDAAPPDADAQFAADAPRFEAGFRAIHGPQERVDADRQT
ncbi:hypothetical protein [Rubrimonas sp.]|uniref:hypothetical protein n=1 Tax=Rubrimonas sp. TaxID=2036015 RepID=UPI002FDE7C2C